MNRTHAQLTALREFTLNGTGHTTRRQQDTMTRRCITWRNHHTGDRANPA
jgi:hypothetical protein